MSGRCTYSYDELNLIAFLIMYFNFLKLPYKSIQYSKLQITHTCIWVSLIQIVADLLEFSLTSLCVVAVWKLAVSINVSLIYNRCRGQLGNTLASYSEVRGSNVGSRIGYRDLDCSWLSSVSPGICWNSTSNYVITTYFT
jgi:hypothetical protein